MTHLTGRLETRGLSVFAGEKMLLRGIDVRVSPRQVFTIIGPSGAGKSTLLRCLNRLIDLDAGLRVEGEILLDDRSIYGADINVDSLRARVGIIFQQPVVFPVSIYKNVVFGARRIFKHGRSELAEIAEQSLREAALWEEVKDRLQDSALKLSVGQQQRLCLARTLAVQPEILLMDEPTSSLDPASTEMIESLILRLKAQRTIILVTHNLSQAARVSETVAHITTANGVGEISVCGPASEVIAQCRQTHENIESPTH